MKTLIQAEWKELLNKDADAVVLDVRTSEEWAEGIIENALCIDFFRKEKFLDEINKLDKSKNYFVYCRSGKRSGMACELLNSKGFKNVYNLRGGILEWKSKLV